MADERLRQLERAAADGDHGARVRWYQARVRLGDLTEHRLWLAAHLGDAAARDALSEGRHVEAEGFDDWVKILTGGGKETCVRAALAAARIAAIGATSGEALQAVQGWVDCPCRDHARIAGAAADQLWSTRSLTEAQTVAAWTARAASELNLSRAATAAGCAILRVPHGRAELWGYPDLGAATEEAIRRVIAANLIPWLLASRDPLPPTELSS